MATNDIELINLTIKPKININSIKKNPNILNNNYINSFSITPINYPPVNKITKPIIEFVKEIDIIDDVDSYTINIPPSPNSSETEVPDDFNINTSPNSSETEVPDDFNIYTHEHKIINCLSLIEKCFLDGITYTYAVFRDIFNIRHQEDI